MRDNDDKNILYSFSRIILLSLSLSFFVLFFLNLYTRVDPCFIQQQSEDSSLSIFSRDV